MPDRSKRQAFGVCVITKSRSNLNTIKRTFARYLGDVLLFVTVTRNSFGNVAYMTWLALLPVSFTGPQQEKSQHQRSSHCVGCGCYA